MKNLKVTVSGNSGAISYTVQKTIKGAQGFAAKIAKEAFYGEDVTIAIVEI
jgi:hypothetical protein